mgnify:CR=1 FL=1
MLEHDHHPNLIILKNEALRKKREQKYLNYLQKIEHRKQANKEFIARNKLNGDENLFSWCWFKCLDWFKQTLINTAELLGLLNKNIRKIWLWIILILVFGFAPVRNFVFKLIGLGL